MASYYINEKDRKLGPFDMIAVIKKIRNGSLNQNTLVSLDIDDESRPARHFEELMKLIAEYGESAGHYGHTEGIDLKEYLVRGFEILQRKVDSTIYAGLFILAAIGVSYPFVRTELFVWFGRVWLNYFFPIFFSYMIFVLFFYYMLLVKRGQGATIKEVFSGVAPVWKQLALGGAMLSMFSLASGALGVWSLVLLPPLFFVLSYVVFVPFLVIDHQVSLRVAVIQSVNQVRAIGIPGALVIWTFLLINIIGAAPIGIGLVISLPVTLGALAEIYDDLFV